MREQEAHLTDPVAEVAAGLAARKDEIAAKMMDVPSEAT